MPAGKLYGLAGLVCLLLVGRDADAGGPCHCRVCYHGFDGGNRAAPYERGLYNDGRARASGDLTRYYVVRDTSSRSLSAGRTVDEIARDAARAEFERLDSARQSPDLPGLTERAISDALVAALVDRLVAKLLNGSGVEPPPEAGGPSPGALLKQRTERLAADVEYRRKQLEEELKILQSIHIQVDPLPQQQ